MMSFGLYVVRLICNSWTFITFFLSETKKKKKKKKEKDFVNDLVFAEKGEDWNWCMHFDEFGISLSAREKGEKVDYERKIMHWLLFKFLI